MVDSQPQLTEGCWPSGTQAAFTKWTTWTLAVTLSHNDSIINTVISILLLLISAGKLTSQLTVDIQILCSDDIQQYRATNWHFTNTLLWCQLGSPTNDGIQCRADQFITRSDFRLIFCHVTNTHTHNRLTVPEEKLTHSHPSWSSDILYQLPPFTTIHSILSVQFTCLTVLFDNLSTMWQSSYNFHEWRERRDITVFYTTCTALHCNTETLEATDNSEYRMLHPSHPQFLEEGTTGFCGGFLPRFSCGNSHHTVLLHAGPHTHAQRPIHSHCKIFHRTLADRSTRRNL